MALHSSKRVSLTAARTARTAWAAGGSLLLGLLIAGGCTFYTGQPNTNPTSNPTANAGAANGGDDGNPNPGGGSGADDTGGTDAGTEAGIAGNAPVAAWVDATGKLTGKTVAAGAVQFLAAKPNEDMLIASLSGFGLWATSDGGKNWRGLGVTGDSDPILNGATALIYDPDHPKVFWEAGIHGPGVYRTDDDGVTIGLVGAVSQANFLSIDFADKDRKLLLAGPHEAKQTLYLSRDAGASWNTIGQNLPDEGGYSSWPIVLDDQTFLAGCSNLIARSTDGGATWKKVSSLGGANIPIVTADKTVYWGSEPDQGLMRSTDMGATWTRIVGAGVIYSSLIFLLPDGRLASRNGDYVLVSPDFGDSWQVASAKFPFTPQQLVYSAQQKAFFISADSAKSQIPARSILRYDWDYEAN